MLLRPRLIEPCLPTPAEKPPSGPGWLHEIKHDGFRLMAWRDVAAVRLLTRNGHDWTDRFPLIREATEALRVRSCLIDGEAVACDDDGLSVFERLRQRRYDRHVFLYAFDLIELNGDDLRREPLDTRKATLASLLKRAAPGLRLNEHLEADGPTVFAHACKMGLEGIVSKRRDSPYRSGRSKDWLKFKNPNAPAGKREAEEDWGGERAVSGRVLMDKFISEDDLILDTARRLSVRSAIRPLSPVSSRLRLGCWGPATGLLSWTS